VTTVDLAPRDVVRHRARRQDDWSWDRLARPLLAVLLGVARFVATAVIDLAIATAICVVLIAGSALFELIAWRN
jgi:hypothetical protein